MRNLCGRINRTTEGWLNLPGSAWLFLDEWFDTRLRKRRIPQVVAVPLNADGARQRGDGFSPGAKRRVRPGGCPTGAEANIGHGGPSGPPFL